MAGNRNSGRRPKPTALKRLEGTRPDRINADEPKPPVTPPQRPDGLSERAAAAWEREAPKCRDMGTLTAADEQAFATLCELIATRELVAQEKAKPTFLALVQDSGIDRAGEVVPLKVRENPLLRMERQTATALKAYFQMFGLEPSGRGRIRAPGQKPVNRLKAFLGGAASASK